MADEPVLVLHLATASLHQEKGREPDGIASAPETRLEAAKVPGGLIERVMMVPDRSAFYRHHLEVNGDRRALIELGVGRGDPGAASEMLDP